MALPIEALEHIIVASLGEGDAITHLPDQIAPTLHFEAAASPAAMMLSFPAAATSGRPNTVAAT